MTGEVVSLPMVWETPASHRQSARSQRSAVDVRRRIVHRRTGGGGESRSAGIPHEDAQGRARPMTAGSGARVPLRFSRRSRRLMAGMPRPSPKPRGSGNILTGRGIAYSFRGQTVVAEIAEVEVNRQTGHVWAKRLVCAHDCGLVVNPRSSAAHGRVRHAALAEPGTARGSAVRHGKGDQRGLGLVIRLSGTPTLRKRSMSCW